VIPTRRRHVWEVQHLDVEGAVILDTLESGDVPQAVRTAGEESAKSAQRLAEILGAPGR
jgi:hydrogenase-1 operon protein HyaF